MIAKDPSFSIIIPNYNGADFLTSCIESITESIKEVSKSKFEIIIIDNNSKDNSLQIIKELSTKNQNLNLKYKITLLSKNTGFAYAVNQGITKAEYPWIVVVNNDLVVDQNWFQLISKNIKENKNPKIITFSGTVLNKDGSKFESQGLKFYYSAKAKNISNGKSFNKKLFLRNKKNKNPKLIWGASASLVVYKKKVIQKIGAFDQDFFAYEEDVDLALRLQNLNYKTLYVPQAISYHLGGGTSQKMGNFRYLMDAKNWIYIIIKNYSSKEILKNFFPICEQRLRNLSRIIKNTPFYKAPFDIINIYIQVIKNLPKMFKKRKEIQKLIKLANKTTT